MIEDRLREIREGLDQANSEAMNLKKQKLEPSPGLKAQIARLIQQEELFLESLALWKTFLGVYPNYDR